MRNEIHRRPAKYQNVGITKIISEAKDNMQVVGKATEACLEKITRYRTKRGRSDATVQIVRGRIGSELGAAINIAVSKVKSFCLQRDIIVTQFTERDPT